MAENAEKRKATRARLTEALADLCQKKSYYDITVGEICSQAGLYRSTFYRYYDTKDQMLREIEHAYVEETRRLTMGVRSYRRDAPDDVRAGYLEELTRDMEYHLENRKLCCFLLSPAGDLYFHQKLVESVGEAAGREIRRSGMDPVEAAYLVSFFANGFIASIYEWLRRLDLSPREMAAFLLAMIGRMQP